MCWNNALHPLHLLSVAKCHSCNRRSGTERLSMELIEGFNAQLIYFVDMMSVIVCFFLYRTHSCVCVTWHNLWNVSTFSASSLNFSFRVRKMLTTHYCSVGNQLQVWDTVLTFVYIKNVGISGEQVFTARWDQRSSYTDLRRKPQKHLPIFREHFSFSSPFPFWG